MVGLHTGLNPEPCCCISAIGTDHIAEEMRFQIVKDWKMGLYNLLIVFACLGGTAAVFSIVTHTCSTVK